MLSVREMFVERKSATGIPTVSLPGLYAIFAKPNDDFGSIRIPDTGFVYIGQSIDLGQRNHFRAVSSGFHSPRRSLGAILKDRLNLQAIPRSSGKSNSNFNNFSFTGEGERRLSEWMELHLDYALFATQGDLLRIEGDAIREAMPPLNLTKWANPQKALIQSLRNKCKAEAKLVWSKSWS